MADRLDERSVATGYIGTPPLASAENVCLMFEQLLQPDYNSSVLAHCPVQTLSVVPILERLEGQFRLFP
ncbi:MAG: hypothetical protein R3C05_30415 [Pirellulaceae bacterium]